MSSLGKVNLFVALVFFAIGWVFGYSSWTDEGKDDRSSHAFKTGALLAVVSLVASALFLD